MNRTASPSSIPTSADGRQIGSDRNRSKTPFSMSVRRVVPVYIVIMMTPCTRIPGSRNWMYSSVLPASASRARVKRSGLDYWPHVRLAEFTSWDAFVAERAPRDDQLFLFEEHGSTSFYEPDYPEDALLVFGCETTGLPEDIWRRYTGRQFHLPMRSQHIRSLNLANTVAAAAYQALRGKFDQNCLTLARRSAACRRRPRR